MLNEVNQTADPKDIKTDLWWTPEEGLVWWVRWVAVAAGGNDHEWITVPELKPWQVVWSDWCVTPAYWISNGDDSTVTVWWHCACFIGICMDCLNYLRLVYGGKELNSCAICWDSCLFKVFVRPALLRCPAVKLLAGWTKICQGFPEFASKICDNYTSFTDPNNGFSIQVDVSKVWCMAPTSRNQLTWNSHELESIMEGKVSKS